MSEILYFIQISCIFVGKSATFQAFWEAVLGRAQSVLLCCAQKALSLSQNHLSMPLAFFSILQEPWQKKTTRSPLLRHGQCPGDVLRVVIGRFAGQEYSFAVSWEYMALFCAL